MTDLTPARAAYARRRPAMDGPPPRAASMVAAGLGGVEPQRAAPGPFRRGRWSSGRVLAAALLIVLAAAWLAGFILANLPS